VRGAVLRDLDGELPAEHRPVAGGTEGVQQPPEELPADAERPATGLLSSQRWSLDHRFIPSADDIIFKFILFATKVCRRPHS
jgi:hypothetical protein